MGGKDAIGIAVVCLLMLALLFDMVRRKRRSRRD